MDTICLLHMAYTVLPSTGLVTLFKVKRWRDIFVRNEMKINWIFKEVVLYPPPRPKMGGSSNGWNGASHTSSAAHREGVCEGYLSLG